MSFNQDSNVPKNPHIGSLPPWCHLSCSEPLSDEHTHSYFQVHQTFSQPHRALNMPESDRPSPHFTSNTYLTSRSATGVTLADDEFVLVHRNEDVLDLDQRAPLTGSTHSSDLPDLILPFPPSSGNIQNSLNLNTSPQICLTLDGASPDYTFERFERAYPHSQESGPAHGRSPEPSFEHIIVFHSHDHRSRLAPVLNTTGTSTGTLTRKQSNHEMIFNFTTGELQKPAAKRRHRKPSESARRNRSDIRFHGGQCASCRQRKRRCELSHLVFESPGSSRGSDGGFSTSSAM